MDIKKTNNGKKGGLLKGKRHYDKDGKPLGGIKAVVTDTGKQVELEGGEVIINREASKKHWKTLSKINQSAGNGVPILPPAGAVDTDPEEYKEGGNIIKFNPNHIPNKWILQYAKKIKSDHPKVWALGGNIFGNEAFENLKRVYERGYWLDSEEWMYIKWRSYVARHKKDFRIEGVIAMLKWVDKVDKGWDYMKQLIEAEIVKKEKKPFGRKAAEKMKKGGEITYKQKYNKRFDYDEDETHDLKEIAKDTGVSKKGLQQIYNKGVGAYKTNPESVRPSVKSKEQWAMGRVYSAVMGGKAAKIDAKELKMVKGGVMGDIFSVSDPDLFKQIITIYNDFENKFGINNYFIDHNDNSVVFLKGTNFSTEEIDLMTKEILRLKQNFDVLGSKKPHAWENNFKFYLNHSVKYKDGGSVKDITCYSCGWSWDKKDSEKHDEYVCHKCGTDNKMAFGGTLTEGLEGILRGKKTKEVTVVSVKKTIVYQDKATGKLIRVEREPFIKNFEETTSAGAQKQFVPEQATKAAEPKSKVEQKQPQLVGYAVGDYFKTTNDGAGGYFDTIRVFNIGSNDVKYASPYGVITKAKTIFENLLLINAFEKIEPPIQEVSWGGLYTDGFCYSVTPFGVEYFQLFAIIGNMYYLNELASYQADATAYLELRAYNEKDVLGLNLVTVKPNGFELGTAINTNDGTWYIAEIEDSKQLLTVQRQQLSANTPDNQKIISAFSYLFIVEKLINGDFKIGEPSTTVIHTKPTQQAVEKQVRQPKEKPKIVDKPIERLKEWSDFNMVSFVTLTEEELANKTLADFAISLSIPTNTVSRSNSKYIFDIINDK